MKQTFKTAAKYGSGLLATLGATASMAQTSAVDLTPITSQFTASDVITAVMAVASVLATIYVAIKAAKIALAWIRGG